MVDFQHFPRLKKKKQTKKWPGQNILFVADLHLFALKNFQGPSGSFVLFLSLQLCMEQLRVLI